MSIAPQPPFTNNVSIILTCTVRPQSIKGVFQNNPKSRIQTYLKSFNRWLNETPFKIVIVENSGYTFPELDSEKQTFQDRLDVITFNEKTNKGSRYLHNNTSKGASEVYAINYAYHLSRLVKTSNFLIKVTGRFFIPQFYEFLSNYDLNTYNGLRQQNENRCEIVGSHIKNFNTIFDIYMTINGKFDSHVENVYRYRLKRLVKKVLVCKRFNIEPTQRGGVKQVYSFL